jgi:hypothetical protein
VAGSRYIHGTNHAQSLSAALDAYHRALTRRWRELIADSIDGGAWDGIPESARGSVWDFTSPAARAHIDAFKGPAARFISPCHYLNWVRNGQNSPLESVACDGWTGDAPRILAIPPNIACGVGTIFEQVEDWAYDERQAVFAELPLFDTHDVGALERAHDRLIEIGGDLGLEANDGSEPGVLPESLGDVEDRYIPERVVNLSGARRQNRDWWEGWTGLAADWAKDGFFASVEPTMYKQAALAGWLANLYATRAAIIEKGRNDAMYWIQWATGSLYRRELVTLADLRDGWKVVQGIGVTTEAALGWSGAGAVAGATISLIGFLGEQVFPEVRQQEYASSLDEVIAGLRQKIGLLNIQLGHLEESYASLARWLEGALRRTHTYNLELYDLTRNSPDGTRGPGADGFYVVIDDVLSIAQACYEAGERYAELLPVIGATSEANPHLADQDGRRRVADERVVEIRDLFESFLETTSGRYLMAGDQARDAATAYVEEDRSQRESFERIMDSWDASGVDDYDVDFDPEEYAQETERRGAGTMDDSRHYAVEGD